MKTKLLLKLTLITLFISFSFIACSEEEPTSYTELRLETNNETLYIDSNQEFEFRVKNENGVDISEEATYFINESSIQGNTFFDDQIGIYNVFAEHNGTRTQTIQLNIIGELPISFTKKVFVEKFTGTWCSNCPSVSQSVYDAASKFENIIPISIHVGDLMEYEKFELLENFHDLKGIPSVYIDRYISWNQTEEQMQSFVNKSADLGLGINSKIDGNSVKVDVKLAFARNINKPIRLGIYLLENNKIFPQSKINADGNIEEIIDYEHNDILRKSLTDLFGDEISSSTNAGDYFARQLEIEIPSYIENPENISIVAFIVDESNEILNAQTAKVNSNKDFD
ncbi:Omp28-related outer membrane protein [Aureivirga sp. CE67]|uniref:Omp28-related outer membrane protein n=1 Tax=Aureivirga sp. CE67 TaxID=1788983 RepID=UPI0018CA6857|nr:Omp28-related outer membrane protein [Aureivirga sp. CE67]